MGTIHYRLKQIDYDGSYNYSQVVEVILELPLVFSLEQNYPNPFNPVTNIRFSIPVSGFTSLKVYDIMGREVASLVNSELIAGIYEYRFDAGKLNSGTYFYSLTSSDFKQTKKMLVLK